LKPPVLNDDPQEYDICDEPNPKDEPVPEEKPAEEEEGAQEGQDEEAE
jgi:hypothetical protein